MKRTLMAAAIGAAITLFGGVIAAQAAPLVVPKTAEAGVSLVQTTGYYQRRHYHRHHWHPRPVVRWHHQHHYYAPRHYVRPHYYQQHRHWTHREHRYNYY